MNITNDRISIQVGLSGYSFRLKEGGNVRHSGWMSPESIFTVPEMQRKYEDVILSVFTPYCCLVPENFHKPELSAQLLSDVVVLPDGAEVEYVHVPAFNAVMLYSNSIGGTLHRVVSETVSNFLGAKPKALPELFYMLDSLSDISEYNKIVASYMDGVLYLVIAQGKTLLLCNTYPAPDFTTAQYFIFMAMKKLQLNPEMSSISFRTLLDNDQEMSLYRYFKSVDTI